jgi:protein-disulfide isomerase
MNDGGLDTGSRSPITPATATTPAAATTSAPVSAKPASSNLIWLIPVACLVVTAALWFQTRRDVASLTESQRLLAAEVAAMRRTPIIDVAGAPARGSADAVVTLIEFSDYECPFCVRHFTETMPLLDRQYIQTGRIRYVFRDFPIDQLHPGAIRGHEAARCAADQGKFWDLHTRMFSPPGTHTDPQIEAKAAEAGVDIAALRTCLSSGRHLEEIRKTGAIASEFGATGTPAFFLGRRDPATEQVRIVKAITGAQPFDVFQKALDALLEK